MENELCHCGRPLHYTDAAIEAYVRKMVELHGETIDVRASDGRWWKVPRHYIALHGIKEQELHKLGFEEIRKT